MGNHMTRIKHVNQRLGTALRCAALAAAALFAFAATAAAQSYSAVMVSQAPPTELSAAVRASLESQAIQVKGPKGVLCEIWLRKDIPSVASPGMELGVVYTQLAPGTLVGAIRFPAQAIDFRDQTVKPGVYTLRYELNPIDGNHQGVAPQRDFLLLGPPSADTTTAKLAFKALVKLSKETTTRNHPSVWSMMPPQDVPAKLPAVVSQDSDNGTIQVLFFKANLGAAGSAKPTTIGLVVVGFSSTS
jgi:hypothetical protein